MTWDMLSTLMTVVGIPAIGVVLAAIERKRSRRDEVQHKFNELILTHMDKTSKVVTLSAKITLGNASSDTHEKLERAVEEYNEFRSDVDSFQRRQTLDALRTKKGSWYNGWDWETQYAP